MALDFIAEIGLNHNGSLDLALQMVEAAKRAGATTVKFQTYLPSERVDPGHPLFSLFEKCQLSDSDFERIIRECEGQGVNFLTTAFGVQSLEILKNLGLSRAKIASFSITNRDLLNEAIASGFQLTVSTGAASIEEILECNEILKKNPKEHIFLHCVSEYPISDPSHLNLRNIAAIASITGRTVGFSDHSVGSEAFFSAALLGCEVFEKHFTTDNHLDGPDQRMSASPVDFEAAVSAAHRGKAVLGETRSGPYYYESGILPFRVRT